MCLNIDRRRTNRHSNEEDKYYIYTKFYNIRNKTLITLYRNSVVNTIKVEACGALDVDPDNDRIEGGAIHAYYLSESVAENLKWSSFNICLTIKVHSNDIIAYGLDGDVCFFRYEFTNDSIKKLKKVGINLVS